MCGICLGGQISYRCFMKTPHIRSVDVVSDGLIVTYDDETRAFYDESVLMAHLQAVEQVPPRKRPRSATLPDRGERLPQVLGR